MARISDRRINSARRRLLERLDDPVLIQFARQGMRPKQIALALIGVELARMRAGGQAKAADKLYRAKVRWVERRIMGAL